MRTTPFLSVKKGKKEERKKEKNSTSCETVEDPDDATLCSDFCHEELSARMSFTSFCERLCDSVAYEPVIALRINRYILAIISAKQRWTNALIVFFA